MSTFYSYQPVSPQDYELIRRFLAENGWADRSVAAWDGERVIGFGRALCDGVSNGYLSMIVVAEAARGQGIGREIVQRLIGNDPEITWMLRAGHGSEGFWSKMGFTNSEIAMERTRQKK